MVPGYCLLLVLISCWHHRSRFLPGNAHLFSNHSFLPLSHTFVRAKSFDCFYKLASGWEMAKY